MNALEELKNLKSESKIDLSGLSLEELQGVIAVAKRFIRVKEREAMEERKEKALTELKTGDIVMVTGNKFAGEMWEVLKCNPKKVKCKRENGETWNIPYAHIIMA